MSSSLDTTQSERLTGMVKWFNNKSGFGFITVSGTGEHANKDIFAHFSSIRITDQYKYLVQGEYVEFNLVKSENEKHEYHAADVTGIMGGPIMCETRRLAVSTQTQTQGQSSTGRPYREKYVADVPEQTDDSFTRVESSRRRPKSVGMRKKVSPSSKADVTV
jgi:CspA family cold shock protein